MLDDVVATEDLLQEWIFKKKKARSFLQKKTTNLLASLLFFNNFSTFLGQTGIYLEDLFAKPEHRGK